MKNEIRRKPMRGDKSLKIVFLNQYAGPLFLSLAEDLVEKFGPGEMYTGHTDEILREIHPDLTLVPSPNQITSSSIARILSWFRYLLFVLGRLTKRRNIPLLFIVSNPPIILWLGFLVHKLWGQRYVILVYDIFPDMMIRFSGLSENGLVSRVWRFLNRKSFENAEVVFTIGGYMAARLDAVYDSKKTSLNQTVVISNWADPEIIQPINKAENWFAKKYGQVDRLTVLYSGTMGLKHNIELMIKSAVKLREVSDLHFLFIGRGEGYNHLSQVVAEEQLTNATLLPFLPEKDITYSLATGDIAVVALDRGGEGVYVPSKTYSSLAAGSALLAICCDENEIAELIRTNKCGLVVPPDDLDSFINALLKFKNDKKFLDVCRTNSKKAVDTYFNRQICTDQYIEILKGVF